jgi:hypothetical protein
MPVIMTNRMKMIDDLVNSAIGSTWMSNKWINGSRVMMMTIKATESALRLINKL